MKKLCSIPLLFLATSCSNNEPAMVMYPSFSSQITLETAEAFARLALDGIVREFPNKPSEVQVDASWARTPRQMHPAFYGSFDWHSSVHGHWMLIRLLHLELLSPQTEEEVRRILNSHLSPGKLRAEAEYFQEKHNRSYERMYGWAWYLRLCAELETWEDPQAKEWREAVRHLENLLVERILDYLPKLSFPVRVGVHRDTAFALTHIWDYANTSENSQLMELISQRAKDWYLADKNWGWRFEPSGQDFLSAGLEEADLMRRILPEKEFSKWLQMFSLPEFSAVEVSDVTDGHLVHLAGLNLSRAWCLEGIASALPQDDPRLDSLRLMAAEHCEKGLEYVTSGFYEGDHWLGSFAVYLTTASGR